MTTEAYPITVSLLGQRVELEVELRFHHERACYGGDAHPDVPESVTLEKVLFNAGGNLYDLKPHFSREQIEAIEAAILADERDAEDVARVELYEGVM